MFTAHMLSKKISEDLHAETRTPKESYENAIRREIGIEKIGPITKQSRTYQLFEYCNHQKLTNGFHQQLNKSTNTRKRRGMRQRSQSPL